MVDNTNHTKNCINIANLKSVKIGICLALGLGLVLFITLATGLLGLRYENQMAQQ